MNRELNICRICGYFEEDYFPWGEDGKTSSFDICSCCNVEFGYEDTILDSIRKFRANWIRSDKFLSNSKYANFLKNIPKEFL